MSVIIFTILLAIFSFVLIRFLKRRRRIRKLINQIPGLEGQFFIGSAWEFLNCPREERLKRNREHFQKYGYFFKAWLGYLPAIFIGNAEDSEIVLSSRININKSQGYKFLEPWIGTGLLTSAGKKWTERRKLLTPAFHFSILSSFHSIIADKCDYLVEKLKIEENSQGFDVYPYINNCTLDIICETAMGVSVNAQEDGSEYMNSIKAIGEVTIKRALSPWFWWDFTFSFSKLYKIQQKALTTIHKFTIDVINQKRMSERKPDQKVEEREEYSSVYDRKKAFLDLILDISEQEGIILTDADIQEEVDTFLFGGHDTVSSAASWAIYMIGSHPQIQEKIVRELFSIFGSSQRQPTTDDATKMKYLECVLKECLRLHPAVYIIGRELSEDIILGGYEVPAGSVIEINIYELHHNPSYFPDPEEFNPENFSSEAIGKRHPFAFLPFSAGPRNCIGQKFAMLEEKLLISSLLRSYKIESLQKAEEISQIPELVLRPGDNGVQIRISKREFSS